MIDYKDQIPKTHKEFSEYLDWLMSDLENNPTRTLDEWSMN